MALCDAVLFMGAELEVGVMVVMIDEIEVAVFDGEFDVVLR